jgi:hypothetical protein
MKGNVIKADSMVEMEGHMHSRPHASQRPQSDTPPAKVLGKYRGQWVAYYDRRVVATGDNFGKVLDEARTLIPGKEPTLMKVPSGELYVL